MTYQSLNPATGKLLKKFDELTDEELETKVAAAVTCFETWRQKTFGGIKDSGYGRELGDMGIKEFVNHKLVHYVAAEAPL